jgi:SAM-dependent methyltransferase
MSDVDFGRRSGDYSALRPGFPRSFYDRLERLVGLDGIDALDVGTGPGIVALELAKRGAQVTGLDISENQIAAARSSADRAGLGDRCRFEVGRAEDTGLDSAAFDLATAGQCWVWFDEQAAMAELLRVLRPGGLLVVAHYCYLPRHSELAGATEQLILEHNPSWTMAGHDGLFPGHIDMLIHGGFELIEQFCYDHDQSFSHESWRGRVRTCNGVGSGILSEDEVLAFDAALAKLLVERFSGEPLRVRHRVWATVVRRP